MMNFLSTFWIILILAAGIAKLLDALLHEHTKDEIKTKLEAIWFKYSDSSPIIIVQIPLHILNVIFNFIFGDRFFSKKALLRASIVSIAILISALVVTGWFTKTILGMERLPWNYFEINMDVAKKMSLNNIVNDTNQNQKIMNQEHLFDKEIKEYAQIALKFNTKTWKVIYSVIFITSLLIINATIDSISLAITRQMLKEVIQTSSIFLILTILITNLCVALFLGTLTLFFTVIVSFPFASLPLIYIIPQFLVKYTLWTSFGLYGSSIVAWKLGGPWFKVLILTTIFPSIFLFLVLSLSTILYPFRKAIYSFLNSFLIRAIDYPKGVFAFITILLTSLGAIIGCIVNLLN
jgi:hypothetical protein